jgi:hypothetical protein
MDLLGINSAGVDSAGVDLAGMVLAGMDLAGMDLAGIDSPGCSSQNEGECESAHCNGTGYVFADCGFPTNYGHDLFSVMRLPCARG